MVGSSCISDLSEKERLSRLIESNIPTGSSSLEVEEFLKANSIKYDWPPKWLPAPNGQEVDWMTAWIEKKSLLKGTYNLTVNFYFDRSNRKLTGFEVFESHKKTF